MGRVMALDLGEKRIGVALSDPTRTIARPLVVLPRTSRRAVVEALRRLIAAHEVEAIVIGLPRSLSGAEGPQAQWVRREAEALARQLPVPVVWWDERLSTVTAATYRALRGARRRDPLDAEAAAVILQDYLEAQRAAAAGPELSSE
ncbi:Holliday junction resolvase RuvX [Thermoflexus sp.]|uniref:Holliday junction resolvase RuvX n=1 Tax=Thermoflexus sp. TaxID=1969742 RepID=UPI0035E44FEC